MGLGSYRLKLTLYLYRCDYILVTCTSGRKNGLDSNKGRRNISNKVFPFWKGWANRHGQNRIMHTQIQTHVSYTFHCKSVNWHSNLYIQSLYLDSMSLPDLTVKGCDVRCHNLSLTQVLCHGRTQGCQQCLVGKREARGESWCSSSKI